MFLTSLSRRTSKAALTPFGLSGHRRPDDVVVLLYHRVGPSRSEIELSSSAFERHLAFLAGTGLVRTIDDVVDGCAGGVAITFDDGTADFYETVLPLLARYRVPVTLYLQTGAVGEPGLSWRQLEECVATGLVRVGSHTHTHRNLAHAFESEAEDEMRRSKEQIEDRLGVRCRHFAYPWAVAGPEADRAARKLFDSAALDAWRTNRGGRIDPHRLGRVPVLRSDGQVFFRRKVAGGLDAEGVLYRAMGRGPWGKA